MGEWNNRITGHGTEAPDQLLANPRNWRIHPFEQQQAVEKVLDKVGWVQNVIVNQRTGHVVDGHLRVGLAISKGEPEIPVVYVDLSEEEEAAVLATLDPLAAMAATDEGALVGLVSDLDELSDLTQGVKMLEGLNGVNPSALPSQDQIDKAEADLKGKYDGKGSQPPDGVMEVECPDCGRKIELAGMNLPNS